MGAENISSHSVYKKVMIIFNPHAGEGLHLPVFLQDLLGVKQRKMDVYENQDTYIKKMINYLEAYGIRGALSLTEGPGHATELARKGVEEHYDLVIAAGGDGTINEVINGLAESDVALGVVPLGTANIFAAQLNLPIELKDACRAMASGTTARIDLGKGAGRYFSCMAGIGFDAYVLRETVPDFKRKWGALAYVVVAFSKVLNYRFRWIVVKIDDQRVRRRGYYVMIANGKYYSGRKILAENARVDDGLLDVCIFRHKNLWGLFLYLLGIRRRDALKYSRMKCFQGHKISVLKNGRHPVHVDAEFLCHTPVEFVVCPKALKVAVDK